MSVALPRPPALPAILAALVVAGVAALWAPAPAGAALTATSVRIDERPAATRVVIAFRGGRLTGLANQVDTIDPDIGNGRAVIRVNARGIRTTAPARGAGGLVVQVARRSGHIVALLDERVAARGRFKFVSYRIPGGRRALVVDVWKTDVTRAAAVRDDGCLRLTRWRNGRGVLRVAGLEREPLFEHNVVLSLRIAGAGGATLALKAVTARGGVLRPDFSGYSRPGRFRGLVRYSVAGPTRAMLEAWSASAKDGSLECLVQAPVVLRP